VSAFGSRITRTGLPIIAVMLLGAAESQIGVFQALSIAPGVLVAVLAGGFVDRSDKRRIMIACDLFRFALVASIPVVWWAGAPGGLTMAHLVAVGALGGAASTLFYIADRAYLPVVIGKPHLLEGNAKLETTEAVAEIGGPAASGGLISAIGAPLAMLVDAASFVWSALHLWRIETVEQPAPPARFDARRDLATGLRALFDHPQLRAVTLAHLTMSIAGGFFMALYAVYCLRVLHLSEWELGLMVACGGVGALGGAAIAAPLARRFGFGPTVIAAAAVALVFQLLIPAARGPSWLVFACLIGHQLVSDGLAIVFHVHTVTLRQTVLPDHLLGRASAAHFAVTTGVVPVAAVVAGVLAGAIGTRTTLWIGMGAGLLAPLFLLPIARLRELPRTCEPGDPGTHIRA
jgi:Na+/melibiose symporter-like transporter